MFQFVGDPEIMRRKILLNKSFNAAMNSCLQRSDLSENYKFLTRCFRPGGGGGGGGATRSGTEKRCSHNLQSGQSAGKSAAYQGGGVFSRDFIYGFEL